MHSLAVVWVPGLGRGVLVGTGAEAQLVQEKNGVLPSPPVHPWSPWVSSPLQAATQQKKKQAATNPSLEDLGRDKVLDDGACEDDVQDHQGLHPER